MRMICAFQFESDAKTFYRELGQRLGQLNLQLAEDKTRIITMVCLVILSH